jgi:hypothetical protein
MSPVPLTATESAFCETQDHLFHDLDVDVRTGFLWPESPTRRVHYLETGAGEPGSDDSRR